MSVPRARRASATCSSAISLSAHPDPERFVSEFSGSERTVAGYLLSEVLQRHPPIGLILAADVLDVPVVRQNNVESTAWGAAAMAGLTLGFWSDQGQELLQRISSNYGGTYRFVPPPPKRKKR